VEVGEDVCVGVVDGVMELQLKTIKSIIGIILKDPRKDLRWALVDGGALLLGPRSLGVPPHLSCP